MDRTTRWTVQPGGPYDQEVGAHLIEKHPEVVAHRVLRSITTEHYSITTEHLEPLHKLQGWNFIDAWFQCAEAHYLAWTHGIHHQDPSLDNLMYRGRRDGKICPVFNDWDLAIDASAPQTHTGLQRTGTMQFMASARLESGAWDGHLPHIYRHDLEAFLYILAWVLCCYKDGQRLHPLPPLFQTWTKGDTNECYNSKYRFIHDERWPQNSLPTDSWSSAMVAFADIIRLFFTVMLRKLAGSPESWMQSRLDNIMARAGGRALPPPKEDDKPTEIWEDFCGAVKEGLLILSDRMNLKKEDLPPRLASFLPDSQMNTPS
ncbi:hypothetical protein K525DRAFT_274378 [Schizophyllum commune Loenen D]|nr:hypothetical protein K525DRAFT_274378 [Schizophyllum commune Loenen D]